MVFRGTFTAILVCLATLTATTSLAHPHVFFTASVEVVFDDEGLAGFEMTWVFDEMFSNMMIMDFDANGNGEFEGSEVRALKEANFSNLRNFSYFTHVTINGKPFTVEYVKDFSASIQDGRMTYRFFVPCHVSATESFKRIYLSVYDQTYYCNVQLKGKPVSYVNNDSFVVNHSIDINRDKAYYYGQIHPEEIALRFKRSNG